ncbi:5-hydroxytryptamine receptor 3A-like [Clarias magur]|uniref:5-hydroxytryptamine receptor 3A-like n=1 Tax=Clarias magur TaxID=1594786 RepID=A0A8J4X320_CLAMG|nr:5-hydroxytryptamine receptor 3A-like [Clarias magur]
MAFSSRIKISMAWIDPDLSWSLANYTFDKIILPVSKIWTPDLTVVNAIYVKVKPVTNDVVVKYDGTVNYAIVIYTTVICKLNLLTYPFVQGSCPVAINGWNQSSCGLNIQYGSVSTVGGQGADWSTLSVNLTTDNTNNHNYIYVTMSSNPFKAMVSLVLPSALIMIADLVSFALPLDGGKRSSFKITLVLSFTMFLLILTDNLPSSGPCSPLLLCSNFIVESLATCTTRRCLATNIIAMELFSPPMPPGCRITVTMSINPFNTIVTLILPSVLIMIADLGSFALPLEGGKRSTFKITLVLSFTMSLLILTDQLPDTGICSPMIRYHFCFCLIILVLSLLISMVFSHFADNGAIMPKWSHVMQRPKPLEFSNTDGKDEIKKGMVTLYLNPFNALVSLVLPTALIMVVDLASFALPLDGERNAFKIKLVFSFAMFLLILSKQLPEGGPCSPLIYYHFCFCLIVLVVSLLVSMILSQLARTGSIWPGRQRKQSGPGTLVQQDNPFNHIGTVT